MSTHSKLLEQQRASAEHQHETHTLGMWFFLLTELMFFSPLFTAYIAYRFVYPAGFAQASRLLDANLGAINTAVLILSSLMMALAVHSVQTGSRRLHMFFLFLTMMFGAIFLGIKAVEYARHYQEHLTPGIAFEYAGEQANVVKLFFMLYFAMTGLHAIHLSIGIGLVATMFIFAGRGNVSRAYWTPVELTGLYWHFVDIVWIFLFPLLYLIRPS